MKMRTGFHSVFGGMVNNRDPDALAEFVLKNGGSVDNFSVDERIDVLKVLNNGQNKADGGCQRYQNAAIRVLQASSSNPKELGLIGTGLGGRRWLQASVSRFTVPELQSLAFQMINATT